MNKIAKKQQRGEEKKVFIAEVALGLFKEKGYNNVTVDEIVKTCETSKGSFYHHFNSKADILNEHFKLADKYYEKSFTTLPKNESAIERLRYFLNDTYIYLENTFGREFLTIIYSRSLESDVHEYFRNPNRKLFSIFEKLLKEILNEFPPSSTMSIESLKQSLIIFAMGIVYYWCTIETNQSLNDIAKQPINHFLNGFIQK